MGKIISFIYGSVAYTIFLGTFLYAIGFVGNIGVPKSIDSGDAGPVVPALMVNMLLLGLFAVQHSGMARKGFKKLLAKIANPAIERSTYVLATNAALILMYWLWQPMPGVVWSIENSAGQAVMYGMFAMGWLIVLLSTFMIHHFDLFGMRQVYVHAKGETYKDLGFRTPGFYRYVRHPIQVGFMIAFWATPMMTMGHLLFAAATTGYIIIAVKMFEERDLMREFPKRYGSYMDQVPGFIPSGKFRETPASELETASY